MLHHRRPLRELMVTQHIIREAVDHHALAAGIGHVHLLAAVDEVGVPEQHIPRLGMELALHERPTGQLAVHGFLVAGVGVLADHEAVATVVV